MDSKRNYELTLLARQDVSDEDVRLALQTLRDIIVSNGGSILYAEYWGLRQLEYKINKNENAHFYMVQISADKEINKMLDEKLRHSTIFIRYLFVKVEDESVLKSRTPNNLTGQENTDEGIVFDKRFYSAMNLGFNLR